MMTTSTTTVPRLDLVAVGPVTVVTLRGPRIVHDYVIDELTAQLLQVAGHPGHANLLLNFGEVKAFSAAGLGMLLRVRRKVEQVGGRLKLCNLNRELLYLFQLKCGDGPKAPFEIHPEEQQALDAF